MKTIYKYGLEINDEQVISLPQGARILTVKVQDGILMAWAVVDTEKPKRDYTIRIAGTGNPVSEDLFSFSYDAPSGYTWEHLGTVQMGHFVWHVFIKY